MIIKRKLFSRLGRVVKTSNNLLNQGKLLDNTSHLGRYADIVRTGSERAKRTIATKYKDNPSVVVSKFKAIDKTSNKIGNVINEQYEKGYKNQKRKYYPKFPKTLKTSDNIDLRVNGNNEVELFRKK